MPKPKHPKEMGNGQFGSEGGFEMYKLIYGLAGRVGRLEGAYAVMILLLGAILTKLMEVW